MKGNPVKIISVSLLLVPLLCSISCDQGPPALVSDQMPLAEGC